MLRCKTDDIIAAAKAAITSYERDCHFIPAGANGIARKEKLKKLLNDLQLEEPAVAFMSLYQFIARDDKLSRLLSHLEENLVELAKINPPASMTLYRSAMNNLNRGEALKNFILRLDCHQSTLRSIN